VRATGRSQRPSSIFYVWQESTIETEMAHRLGPTWEHLAPPPVCTIGSSSCVDGILSVLKRRTRGCHTYGVFCVDLRSRASQCRMGAGTTNPLRRPSEGTFTWTSLPVMARLRTACHIGRARRRAAGHSRVVWSGLRNASQGDHERGDRRRQRGRIELAIVRSRRCAVRRRDSLPVRDGGHHPRSWMHEYKRRYGQPDGTDFGYGVPIV
jgi:hypothetical protein